MEKKSGINEVVEFVTKAGKLSKYPANSANAIVSAIRTAEKGLTQDEPVTIDYFVEHLAELFGRQPDLALSQESVNVYMTRIKRGINDFKEYGTSPGAIYKWTPKERKVKMIREKNGTEKNSQNNGYEEKPANPYEPIREVSGTKLNLLLWRIRPGVVIKIELPEDLNEGDVRKIKGYLDLELDMH